MVATTVDLSSSVPVLFGVPIGEGACQCTGLNVTLLSLAGESGFCSFRAITFRVLYIFHSYQASFLTGKFPLASLSFDLWRFYGRSFCLFTEATCT